MVVLLCLIITNFFFVCLFVCLLVCLCGVCSGTMDSVASQLVAVGSNAFQQEETKVSVFFFFQTSLSNVSINSTQLFRHTALRDVCRTASVCCSF